MMLRYLGPDKGMRIGTKPLMNGELVDYDDSLAERGDFEIAEMSGTDISEEEEELTDG